MDIRKEAEDLLPPNYSKMYPAIADVEDVITLNVGGVHHEVLWKTLQSIPNSRLGKLPNPNVEKQQATNGPQNRNVYFDRNPTIFTSILDFYRTGRLHFNDDICPDSISDELQFWMISEDSISPCCRETFLMKKMKTARKVKNENKLNENQQIKASHIWNILENPTSSIPARLYSILSIFFVLLFLLATALNSIDSITGYDMYGRAVPNRKLLVVQAVCICFCAIEFIIRFIFSPNKFQFAKGMMNILDILAILPCVLHVLHNFVNLTQIDEGTPHTSYDSYDYDSYSNTDEQDLENSATMKTLDFASLFWIIWVFKLIRYSAGLQKFARILKSSCSDIFLLIQVLFVGVFFFGSLVYFCEKDEEGGFVSLPQSFWWAIITMTTVGYGDIFPQTGLGKLFASFCVIFGVLSMFVPVAIIAINSAGLYKEKEEEAQMAEYKKVLKSTGKP